MEYRKKRVSNEKKEVKAEESSVAEIPMERKKLELKPRSKPIGETVSRPASIFGNAKPRDETAFQKNNKTEEDEKEKTAAGVAVEIPAKRKERKVPAPVIIEEPVVVKPVAVKKRTTTKNRFAVDDDSEEEVSSSE